MKYTIEQLYIALGEGSITVEQFMEVLIDNLGRRRAERIIRRDIKKYKTAMEKFLK